MTPPAIVNHSVVLDSGAGAQESTGSNVGFVIAGVIGAIVVVLVFVVITVRYLRKALRVTIDSESGLGSLRRRGLPSNSEVADTLLVPHPSPANLNDGPSPDGEPEDFASSLWQQSDKINASTKKGAVLYMSLANHTQETFPSSSDSSYGTPLSPSALHPRFLYKVPPTSPQPVRPQVPVRTPSTSRPKMRGRPSDFEPFPLMDSLIESAYSQSQASAMTSTDSTNSAAATCSVPPADVPACPTPSMIHFPTSPPSDIPASSNTPSWPTSLTTAFQNTTSRPSTVSLTSTNLPSRYPSLAASSANTSVSTANPPPLPPPPSTQAEMESHAIRPLPTPPSPAPRPLPKIHSLSAATRPLSVKSVFSTIPCAPGLPMLTIHESRPSSSTDKAYLRTSSAPQYAVYAASARSPSASASFDFVHATTRMSAYTPSAPGRGSANDDRAVRRQTPFLRANSVPVRGINKTRAVRREPLLAMGTGRGLGVGTGAGLGLALLGRAHTYTGPTDVAGAPGAVTPSDSPHTSIHPPHIPSGIPSPTPNAPLTGPEKDVLTTRDDADCAPLTPSHTPSPSPHSISSTGSYPDSNLTATPAAAASALHPQSHPQTRALTPAPHLPALSLTPFSLDFDDGTLFNDAHPAGPGTPTSVSASAPAPVFVS